MAGLQPAAGGSGHAVHAQYRIEAFGLPVGEAKLVVELNGETYTVNARGRTTGITRLFAEGSGNVNATGALVDGVVKPAAFSQQFKEGDKKSSVDLVFAENRVDDVVIDPAPRRRSLAKRVPVTEAHMRDVVDPVSALLAAMAGPPTGDEATACEKTVRVFTGETRFDIRLHDKGTSRYRGGKRSFDGTAIVCGVEYVPVAGHKPDSKDVAFQVQNRDNEVWFARIGDVGLLVPVLWRLKFRPGKVEIALSEIEVR